MNPFEVASIVEEGNAFKAVQETVSANSSLPEGLSYWQMMHITYQCKRLLPEHRRSVMNYMSSLDMTEEVQMMYTACNNAIGHLIAIKNNTW